MVNIFFTIRKSRKTVLVVAALMAAGILGAADEAGEPASGTALAPGDEVARLRTQLAAQQKQLQALQQTLEQQQQALERVTPGHPAGSAVPTLGSVASLRPVLPAQTPPAVPGTFATVSGAAVKPSNPCEAGTEATPPPYLRLGDSCITPVGFMDLTAFWRDKNAASSLGTNFAGIPYNNAAAGRLSEFRFTPQNSRIGFRIDGSWKDLRFTGYNEFDFLGTSGSNNLGITNGAFVPRLRLFWVDVRKGKYEMLAGQSWSMLTPNRKGISAIPGDLFYSQVVDTNYMIGLTWTRQPGVRFLYHPDNKVTFGLSFENPDQQIGGSGGLSATAVTLPAASALAGIGGTQVDNATNVLNTPNVRPDIIAKVAFDPSAKFHAEIAGIDRAFKIWNAATNTYSHNGGAGLQFGMNAEVVKNLRAITSNFYSDGGGRYLFGTVPDFIVRANGSLSPIKAMGTVDGLEMSVKNTLFYGYYGAAYGARNTALDANGTTKIGYGFAGSSNADNRAMQEVTFGFNQTFWKSPKYGAINYMMQYQYTIRAPWSYVAGQAGGKGTQDSAVYGNIRYTLPGGAPNF